LAHAALLSQIRERERQPRLKARLVIDGGELAITLDLSSHVLIMPHPAICFHGWLCLCCFQ